jgi:chorismate mutase
MNLPSLRQRIDAVDRRLLRLLTARATLAIRVGQVKRARGLPVFDPGREAAILRQVARENPGPLSRAAVQDIFRAILRQSREVEAAATTRHTPRRSRARGHAAALRD